MEIKNNKIKLSREEFEKAYRSLLSISDFSKGLEVCYPYLGNKFLNMDYVILNRFYGWIKICDDNRGFVKTNIEAINDIRQTLNFTKTLLYGTSPFKPKINDFFRKHIDTIEKLLDDCDETYKKFINI